MSKQKELFTKTISSLSDLYKNNPDKLEAINLTAKVAMEAFGDVPGLSSTIGKSKVDTSIHHAPINDKAVKGPTTSDKPNARVLDAAKMLVRRWAKSEPVECQKWVNKELTNDIMNAASIKFGNVSDDWKKSFNDEVSGDADKDRERINKDIKDKESKSAKKAEKDAQKAGEAESKSKEKEFWENQKKLDKEGKKQQHRDALKKMDEEDEKYESNRAILQKYGKDPEMYADTKKRGLATKFGRGLKRMWHKLHEAAEQAMRNGDTAMLESIKKQMNDMKTVCESVGIDLDSILVG